MALDMKKHTYFNSCVNWDASDVHAEGGLCDMIDAGRDITRRTFTRRVDRESRIELERAFGYSRESLTMARDWAVNYRKSKLHGQTVYYIVHSAIEYVFAP